MFNDQTSSPSEFQSPSVGEVWIFSGTTHCVQGSSRKYPSPESHGNSRGKGLWYSSWTFPVGSGIGEHTLKFSRGFSELKHKCGYYWSLSFVNEVWGHVVFSILFTIVKSLIAPWWLSIIHWELYLFELANCQRKSNLESQLKEDIFPHLVDFIIFLISLRCSF